MNKTGMIVIVAVAAALGAGYWLGSRGGHESAAPPAAAQTEGAKQERRLLFYRNPMGLPDTSPVPKKDPMGMDYIPVYEGEESAEAGSGIVVSTEKVQKLGVRTEIAALREMSRSVRASGRIEVDERRLHTVSPKFEGWIEKLHVNTTGQQVGRGQPLAEVYSPELVSAQKEYAIAAQGRESLRDAGPEAQAGMKQLADSGLSRLRNWDISDEQIARLREGGEVRRTLTLRSPASGIVMEKKAVAGMRFMPGEMLYQVADLSSVWVIADVFEQDIGLVRVGQQATVRIGAYPDKAFEGTVTYVYPTLKAETRSVPVRVELANPGGLLKPAMFASLELSAAGGAKVLAVPSSAVIDSGVRRVVLVQSGGDAKAGRFEPREVKLGARSGDYVEVLEGVREGEPVVVAANFLIDAESNLKAAIGGFGKVSPGDTAKPASASHKAEGTLKSIDAAAGTVSVSHDPVASLGWPAMTMDFVLANPSLAGKLQPGSPIAFEFVERKPGEWVIVKLEAKGAARPSAHAGH
ncbi:MAG: efflux RND transporter periplasmic adaptor subunit [Rhodocyclales bacterium]|nr:efflux RND transporter periplasmic adaptor subunit [Rhodocyclales bacterium]